MLSPSLKVCAAIALIALPIILQAQDESSDFNALQAKAEEQGLVRVIVRLDAPYQSPPELSREAAREQESTISAAQRSFTAAASESSGVDQVSAIEGLPLVVLEVTAEALVELQANGEIEQIVEDVPVPPTLAQSVPLIGAPDAWAGGAAGSGQTVAILDTGVDSAHPAFTNKIVSQDCFSTTSTANNSVSLCPNGQSQQTGGNAAQDCNTSVRGCGHGTHVAGIAAGNGGGVQGVARDARIAAMQIFSRFNDPANCRGNAPCVLTYTSDQIRGLQRVQQLAGQFKIASVNMSLGGGQFQTACDADPRKAVIDTLLSLGVATVIASGNDGFTNAVGAPSCISTAVTVGSTTKSDALSGFSNHSNLVDLLAPGSSIVSAGSGGGTTPKSGTSMATPHVAGAFAVASSKSPGTSVGAIESDFKSNGKPVNAHGITKPRLDLRYLGGGGSTAGQIGYAWANDPSVQSYNPSTTYSYNEAGGPITVTRSAPGTYVVRFAGLGGSGTAGGHVQVTGYGSDSNDCKIRFWSSSGPDMVASILCLSPTGAHSDARYTVLVYGPD